MTVLIKRGAWYLTGNQRGYGWGLSRDCATRFADARWARSLLAQGAELEIVDEQGDLFG